MTPSMAESEDFPFIGVTISTTSVDLEKGGDKSNTMIGLRYGQQDLDWRTMFTYSASGALKILSAEVDKVLQDNFMGVEGLRPYIGVSMGFLNYSDGGSSDKGFFYGANLGMIVYVTDRIDADIAYHYYQSGETELIDKITGFSLSVNYFY